MNINDINIYLVSLEKDKERRENLNIIPDYTYAVDGSKLHIDKLKTENIFLIFNITIYNRHPVYLRY